MKTFKWLVIAVVVIGALALAIADKSRLRKSEAEAVAPAEVPIATEIVEPTAARPEPASAPTVELPEATARALQAALPQEEPTPAAILLPEVTLDSDTILATVNGVALRLQDLMPIRPAVVTQQIVRADAYDELLKRAIERELTLQAAQARGVELDAAQKQSLESIRADAFARADAPYTLAGYDAEAQAAFEVRDNTAQMLQNTLLGAAGPPAQYVTPEQVQAYYEAHQAEYGKLPKNESARQKAWLPIETEIRNRLVTEAFIQHEQKRRKLLDELKAAAVIEQPVRPAGI